MTRQVLALVFAAALQASLSTSASAQSQPDRPATLDVASIRRQASQLTDIRAILADPDPNVRLLAIREIARNGDAVQRQTAIETGLSSAETAMQEVAIRAMMVDIGKVVFAITDMDGKTPKDGPSSYTLSIEKFDPDTGRVSGPSWSGQFSGAVLNFQANGATLGRLAWSPEHGVFEGVINMDFGKVSADRRASWRPR